MPKQQFEYLILKLWDSKWLDSLGRSGETSKQKFTNDSSDFSGLLNKLGTDGWELVCNTISDSPNARLVFKRPMDSL